jgi:hypothetical protein
VACLLLSIEKLDPNCGEYGDDLVEKGAAGCSLPVKLQTFFKSVSLASSGCKRSYLPWVR